MLIAGLAVFGMASLVAAFSPSPQLLIVGRALLAVGAAMMMPATLSIIRLTFNDERERALAIGLWSAVASGGAAVGPLIGGVLLEYFWWGSVFLINVPIVAAALIAGLVLILRQQGSSEAPWDLLSSLIILVGLVRLAFAIKEVAMEAPSYPRAATAAVIGALALSWFIRRQRRSTAPLIDLTLFDNRDFRLAVLVALVSAFSIVGLGLVLSQRLQLVLGYSPLHAALFLLPSSLMAIIGGPLAGWLAPRCGIGYVTAAALLLGGLGEAGLLITSNGGPAPQILCLSVFALGIGASIAAASLAIIATPPPSAPVWPHRSRKSPSSSAARSASPCWAAFWPAYARRSSYCRTEAVLPPAAHEGVDQALVVAGTLPPNVAHLLARSVHQAFDSAYFTALAINAALLAVVAIMAWRARAAPPANRRVRPMRLVPVTPP